MQLDVDINKCIDYQKNICYYMNDLQYLVSTLCSQSNVYDKDAQVRATASAINICERMKNLLVQFNFIYDNIKEEDEVVNRDNINNDTSSDIAGDDMELCDAPTVSDAILEDSESEHEEVGSQEDIECIE